MIFQLINNLSNNDNSIALIKKMFNDNYLRVIKLLKKELQTNGKYDALEILKDKYKLNLLIAFLKPTYIQILDVRSSILNVNIIKNIYKLIYVKKSDYPEVNFYEPTFVWNEDLPLETINELKLMQNQTKDLGLYLFLKEYYHLFRRSEYHLLEGLEKVGFLPIVYNKDEKTYQQRNEIKKFVEIIRQKMTNKRVYFPKTLKNVLGDLIFTIK